MKWWGWGEEDVSFTHEDKPEFAPFVKRASTSTCRAADVAPVAFEDLDDP